MNDFYREKNILRRMPNIYVMGMYVLVYVCIKSQCARNLQMINDDYICVALSKLMYQVVVDIDVRICPIIEVRASNYIQ